MDTNQLQPRKRKKQRGKGFDRISELPDDILFTILSFLPTREAAATSILSPRWINLWKHTPNLDFIDPNYVRKTTEIEHTSWDVETCQNVKMVNKVLESHQALSLKQFRIQFYINKSAQSTVTKWLEFVWSRQVERLDLYCSCVRRKYTIVLQDMLGEMRPMKYLKEMSLINMKVSGEDISLFLRNCPLLRKLTIRHSTLTSDVHVCGETLVLEYLQLHYCVLRESIINVSAPNLSEVKIDANPGQLWFKNVPRLVVATFMHHFAFEVSCITSQLQKLTISLSNTESILANSFPQMPNLKELIIRDSSLYKHGCLVAVTSVISACPRLQKFKFKFLDTFKDEIPEAERCPHQLIEMLEFKGSSASNIIQSMTFIADDCDEFQKLNTCAPVMSKAEVQAHRDHLTQLKAKLYQFRLRFFKIA